MSWDLFYDEYFSSWQIFMLLFQHSLQKNSAKGIRYSANLTEHKVRFIPLWSASFFSICSWYCHKKVFTVKVAGECRNEAPWWPSRQNCIIWLDGCVKFLPAFFAAGEITITTMITVLTREHLEHLVVLAHAKQKRKQAYLSCNYPTQGLLRGWRDIILNGQESHE